MLNHIRSNLLLLVLTLLICSVFYPLTLWAIGRIPLLRDNAQGSLLLDEHGKIIGSRLIAQPFAGDEYFQPRPSAASYNAMASAGSNWGANNYLLRDRVARALGPIVRYGSGAEKIGKKPGTLVGEDIETWFGKDRYQNQSGIVAQWAASHPGLGEAWIKSTGDAVKNQWKEGDKDKKNNEAFILQWQKDLPELFSAWKESEAYRVWKKENPKEESPSNADLVQPFFSAFALQFPGEWPSLEDIDSKEKQPRKKLARVKQGSDIQSVFFDMWRQDNPDVPLEPVPADMVMASGSGLDPHITFDNALYQLKFRVADAQAEKMVADLATPSLRAKGAEVTEEQRKQILAEARKKLEKKLGMEPAQYIQPLLAKLLDEKKVAPFNGLVGVPIINVLELNIALRNKMDAFYKTMQ